VATLGHSLSRAILVAVSVAGVFARTAPCAIAEPATFCVSCKNPDQIYRCQVIADDFRSRDALRLYCVIRTAKEGNHASCSVERNVAVCNGVAKLYSYDGPALPPDMASDPQITTLPPATDQAQGAAQKDKSPKTMVELGGRAINASRQRWRKTFGGSSEQDGLAPVPLTSAEPQPAAPTSINASAAESAPGLMRRAAESTGAAVRKSYRCVLSLFRNCRGEAAESQALQ
jgi:hypothetical protein